MEKRVNRKIRWEGFDYYFKTYGCDEELEPLIQDELIAFETCMTYQDYVRNRKKLYTRLKQLGVVKPGDRDISGDLLSQPEKKVQKILGLLETC
jgi:hypothetical protein